MTIRACQETYLRKAQTTLGDAFEYAVNTCGIPGEDFIKLFTASSVSKRIENGDVSCITGKSGIEIAINVINDTLGEQPDITPEPKYSHSREYRISKTLDCTIEDLLEK